MENQRSKGIAYMNTEVKRKVNAVEYGNLPEGPPQQLIDGEITMTPSPNFMHQSIILEIATLLKNYVIDQNLGYVNISPIDVFLKNDEVYQPDIIFISKDRKEIIKDKIIGVPDLVIEVLSPSNAYYDLTHKKNIYEETGVKEFWVVDPEEKTVEIYENVKNTFLLYSKAKNSGVVNSKILPGLSIEIVKLFVSI